MKSFIYHVYIKSIKKYLIFKDYLDGKKKISSVRYFARQPAKHILPVSEYTLDNVLPIKMALLSESDELGIVSWNIYKQQRLNWYSVLNKLVINKHLILLQEAQNSSKLIDFIISQHLIAYQVPTIILPHYAYGVMTLARSHPIYCCPLQEKEPLLRLPKSALITVYPLHNGRNLMIINIHAVNFTFGVDIYSRQLRNIGEYVKKHQGPMIFAGDFNTWSRQRINELKRFTCSLRMKEVNFDADERTIIFGYPLDYVFYHNLTLLDAEVIKTESSDHNPISVKFNIK
ncbi:MAG: endonuclease/exonuclease/phosphatase family protein [Arsenophonus sp. NC-PE1-MAG3]